MAAAPGCTTEFFELIVKSGLVDQAGLEAYGDLPDDPTACAAVLISKGLLTKFQAKLLLNGRYKGFKLGAYFIREQIGQGGMGAVYLAEHETLRRKVALKVLTLPKDGNAALSVERFLREARSAAALDHPNIVRLHDVGKSGETHFLVMEFVEGQTLDQIVTKGGPISSSRAVEYIAQAAAGLQHACEKGFIHRDIKPANLMLSKDGTIKILDMGLARPTDENADKLTEVMDKGAIVGTADFISPEQAMNGPLDVRSDIYSLGASFYSLVTGQPPFNGNTTQKLIQHQMKEAPSVTAIDKTFPAGLSQIVSKMLAKKPEHRYQTPADVIKALAEWLPQEASARVAAAISGTDLAHSGELTATLSEIANGTRRIGTSPKLEAPEKKRDWFWPAVAGAVLIVAGCIAAVLSLSIGETPWKPNEIQAEGGPPPEPKKDPAATPKKAPSKTATPKGETKKAPEPKKEPVPEPVSTPPPPAAPILYALDLTKQEPFQITGRSTTKPDSNTKVWKTETSTGGQMPKGWTCGTYGTDAVGEFVSRLVDGQPALGFRNAGAANASAMFLTPRFESATSKAFISFECKIESPTAKVTVKYIQHTPARKSATDFLIVPTSKDQSWVTIQKEIDLKDGTGGVLEFHPRSTEFVWIRGLTIIQGGTAIDKPNRDAPLYSVNFGGMKPASQKYDNYPKAFAVRTIEGQALPGGVSINQHRMNVSSEYSIAEVDGRTAFGFRLIDGETGVQIQTTCADAITMLKPGDSVTAKVVYRFEGTGSGILSFQSGGLPYTKYNAVPLLPTGGQWKTAATTFTRPAGEANKYELILNAGNAAPDKPRAEGTIHIQSIEVKYADAK